MVDNNTQHQSIEATNNVTQQKLPRRTYSKKEKIIWLVVGAVILFGSLFTWWSISVNLWYKQVDSVDIRTVDGIESSYSQDNGRNKVYIRDNQFGVFYVKVDRGGGSVTVVHFSTKHIISKRIYALK